MYNNNRPISISYYDKLFNEIMNNINEEERLRQNHEQIELSREIVEQPIELPLVDTSLLPEERREIPSAPPVPSLRFDFYKKDIKKSKVALEINSKILELQCKIL